MGNRGNLNLIIAVLFVVVIFMGVGLSYLSSRPVDNMIGLTAPEVSPSEEAPVASESANVSLDGVNLVFDPPESFDVTLMQDIRARVILPYLDYAAFIKGDGPVAGVKIVAATETKGQTTYRMEATHTNGVVRTVDIDRDSTGVGWWTPVCDGLCIFSDPYAQKYPEVVSHFSQ